MTYAVCVRCGSPKSNPLTPCAVCKLDPSTDRQTAAQSLILSTRHYDERTDHRRSKRELKEIGQRIKAGEAFKFDSQDLDRLLEMKTALDRGLAAQDKVRIAVFLFFLLLVPLIGVVLLALKFFRGQGE